MTLILSLLALALSAHADIGPKPSAYFDWRSHNGVQLGTVQLLQCKDPACKEASVLQQLGPQHFGCCESGCFAMAYGFSDYSQLSAVIDGKEVKSAPFVIARPNGYFEIMSGKGRLEVHAVKSLPQEKLRSLEICK